MHTFKKLPVNKPSKVKTGVKKANFLYYLRLNSFVSEPMIHQGRKLSNGSACEDVTLVNEMGAG